MSSSNISAIVKKISSTEPLVSAVLKVVPSSTPQQNLAEANDWFDIAFGMIDWESLDSSRVSPQEGN